MAKSPLRIELSGEEARELRWLAETRSSRGSTAPGPSPPTGPSWMEKAGPVLDLYPGRWEGRMLQPGRVRDLRRREALDPGALAGPRDAGALPGFARAAGRAHQ